MAFRQKLFGLGKRFISSRLFRLSGKYATLDVLRICLVLIGSFATVRYIGVTLYGQFQYFIAWLAVLPLFYIFWDQGIRRFGPLASRERLCDLVAFSITAKTATFFVILPALLVFWWFAGSTADTRGSLAQSIELQLVVIFIGLDVIGISVFNTLSQIVSAQQRFQGLMLVTFLRAVLPVIWLLYIVTVLLPAAEKALALIAIGRFAATAVMSLVLLVMVFRSWPSFWGDVGARLARPVATARRTLTKEMRQYTLPTSITGISNFVENYLGSILLGTYAAMGDVAVFAIVRNVFQVIFRLSANAGQFLLPGLVKARDGRDREFDRLFSRTGYLYLIGAGGVCMLLHFGHGFVVSLWGLSITPTISALFVVLSVSFLVNSMQYVENLSMQLSSDQRGSIPAALAKIAIGVGLLALLVPVFGTVGAAWAEIAGRVAYYACLIPFLLAIGIRKLPEVTALLALTMVLIGLVLLFEGFIPPSDLKIDDLMILVR